MKSRWQNVSENVRFNAMDLHKLLNPFFRTKPIPGTFKSQPKQRLGTARQGQQEKEVMLQRAQKMLFVVM